MAISEDQKEFEKHKVVTNGGHTIKNLRDAFEYVEDEKHWKNPIECVVNVDILVVTIEAIKYFHGVVPTIKAIDCGKFIINSSGYNC